MALALVAVPGAADEAAAASCPNPRTCNGYSAGRNRWLTNSRGEVFVTYYINPRQPWIDEASAVRAIRDGAAVWMRANPKLTLRYMGTTDAVTSISDGVNVVLFTPTMLTEQIATTSLSHPGNGHIVEADIQFNMLLPWRYTPCKQADNSCTAVETKDMIAAFELQAIATHEFGHFLGLDHVTGSSRRELTMYDDDGIEPGERKLATLGYGDILGIRAMYACKGCPRPRVYVP